MRKSKEQQKVYSTLQKFWRLLDQNGEGMIPKSHIAEYYEQVYGQRGAWRNLVDASDLKSDETSREGSSPSAPTK